MNWIPGAGTYKRTYDWTTQLPKNNGKFKKSPRYVIAEEIQNMSKKKERTSPGPAFYN